MSRAITLLLATVLILAVLCTSAWAAEKNLSELSGEAQYKWQGGNTYIVDKGITIDERITVTGSVTLMLNDGSLLYTDTGINVPPDAELTITTPNAAGGTGELFVQVNPNGAAAIGGNSGEACGKITINGGKVHAEAVGAAEITNGAGIGGGIGGDGGTITINGGTVNARSSNGAGIGGGDGGDGGNIMINGGSVTATSLKGAGIGGGVGGAGGNITISGGTVNSSSTGAHGSLGAWLVGAGIGGGLNATDHGTLSSGANGWAWINTSSVGAKIADNFSGVIFDDSVGGNGKVYGSATVSGDVAIPNGKTLEIPSGKTLTIKQGSTLDATGNGTIVNNAASNTNDGILKLAPTSTPKSDIPALGLSGSGRIWIDGRWYSNSGLAYGKIEVTYGSGGTASASASQDVLEGTAITLTASPDVGYLFDAWVAVSPTSLDISNDKFTMPDEPVEVKATFKALPPTPTPDPSPTPPPAPTPDPTPSYIPGKYTDAIDRDRSDTLWNALTGGDMTIYINVDLAKFDNSVSLDDVPLTMDTATVSNDFGARAGSTVVTIWEKTLKEHIKADGVHTAEVGFKDGTAIHTFTVRGTGETPPQKQNTSGGACASGAAALVGLIGLAAIKRRKK